MDNGYEMHHGSTTHSMMCFCLGAAVGATVMLLYAPASGREVRSQIADKATELKDNAADLKEQAVNKVSDWKDTARAVTHDTLTRAADAFDGAGVHTASVAHKAKI